MRESDRSIRWGARLVAVMAVVGLAAEARGNLPEGARYPTEVASTIGWTEDSANFVYVRDIEEDAGIRMKELALVVVDARSGREKSYRLNLEGRAAFQDWLNWRPLVNARLQARGFFSETETRANGAYVVIQAKHGIWPPHKGGISYGQTDELSDPFCEWNVTSDWAKPIPCAIQQGKRIFLSHTFVPPKDTAVAQVIFLWSPDGSRIAWLLRGQPAVKEGEKLETVGDRGKPLYKSFYEVVVDRTVGPRIQLAGKEVTPELFEKVAVAIEKEGFAPTSQDTERPMGDKTVVYARRGFEAEGKKIAAVVPGGATVKPLAGKGRFDVIVALGRSAQGQ